MVFVSGGIICRFKDCHLPNILDGRKAIIDDSKGNSIWGGASCELSVSRSEMFTLADCSEVPVHDAFGAVALGQWWDSPLWRETHSKLLTLWWPRHKGRKKNGTIPFGRIPPIIRQPLTRPTSSHCEHSGNRKQSVNPGDFGGCAGAILIF